MDKWSEHVSWLWSIRHLFAQKVDRIICWVDDQESCSRLLLYSCRQNRSRNPGGCVVKDLGNVRSASATERVDSLKEAHLIVVK